MLLYLFKDRYEKKAVGVLTLTAYLNQYRSQSHLDGSLTGAQQGRYP